MLVHVLSALRAAECDVCISRVESFVADRTVFLDRLATLLQALLEVPGCSTEEILVDCKLAVQVAGLDMDESTYTLLH